VNEVTVKIHEYFFWSPIMGTEAVRFSVFNAHGGEYFAIVPLDGKGSTLRALRQRWAERFFEAIQSGLDPGEVL
jgi:hypothetical protein